MPYIEVSQTVGILMARSPCHQALWICVVLLLGGQSAGEASSPSCPNDVEEKGERELRATKAEGVDNNSIDGSTGVEPEDHAILQANYYKRLHKPEWSLADWEKVSCAAGCGCAPLDNKRGTTVCPSAINRSFCRQHFSFDNRLSVCSIEDAPAYVTSQSMSDRAR